MQSDLQSLANQLTKQSASKGQNDHFMSHAVTRFAKLSGIPLSIKEVTVDDRISRHGGIRVKLNAAVSNVVFPGTQEFVLNSKVGSGYILSSVTDGARSIKFKDINRKMVAALIVKMVVEIIVSESLDAIVGPAEGTN
jgi:hypothetical protein